MVYIKDMTRYSDKFLIKLLESCSFQISSKCLLNRSERKTNANVQISVGISKNDRQMTLRYFNLGPDPNNEIIHFQRQVATVKRDRVTLTTLTHTHTHTHTKKKVPIVVNLIFTHV